MTRRQTYCSLLRKALRDEASAVRMYRRMARLAPSGLARNAHLRQSMDEAMHYKIDSLFCKRYC